LAIITFYVPFLHFLELFYDFGIKFVIAFFEVHVMLVLLSLVGWRQLT